MASVSSELVTLPDGDRSPAKPSEIADGDGNAAASVRGKRPVWNVPANGAIEVASVMGGVSWPTPSESARVAPKPSPSDPPKPLSNGPVPAPLGTGISSPKPSSINPAPNPSSPSTPTRQKSAKGIGGSTGSGKLTNGGLPLPLQPPAEIPEITTSKQAIQEPSPKALPNNSTHIGDNGGRVPPQIHEHHRNYGANRRGGGVGAHHHSYGNRDREWNQRNFAGRDAPHTQHLPQHRAVRPFIRPPPPPQVSSPFIPPPPPMVRPFGGPMGYPDMPSQLFYVAPSPPPESLRGVPFVAHPAPPAMFFPPVDAQRAILLKQIEYYFSPENLCKDTYLRQKMDAQGWVPISLIAGFKRVLEITNNIQYILDTVQFSTVVELQGGRIRRRNDWMKWPPLPPTSNNYSGGPSTPQSSASPSLDTVVAHMQTIGLEEATEQKGMRGGWNETVLSRSASGILNNQHPVGGNGSGQASGRGGGSHTSSDRSNYARSLTRSDTL